MTAQSSLAKVFAMDESKERDGIVIQYGAIRVRLARAGGANARFQKVVEEVTRPYRRMIEVGMLDREQDKALSREIFAKAVVLEWSGVTADDGTTEVPFTVDTAITCFERYPEFFNFVVSEAQRMANYRQAALEGEAKN